MQSTFYKKILIVDDSKIDQFVSAAVIKKSFFASEIVSYTAVTPAIAYLEEMIAKGGELPQLVLLDINMPVLDGFDFLDRYIQLPAQLHALCTVIMISSSNSSDDLAKVKTYPIVQRFFSKPLSDNILETIKENFAAKVAC